MTGAAAWILAPCSAAWKRAARSSGGCGPPWWPRPQNDAGFMSQLKEAIIETTILVIPDILERFTPIEDSLQGQGENFRMSLRMQDSGMLARIPIRRDAGGGYDIEGGYRGPGGQLSADAVHGLGRRYLQQRPAEQAAGKDPGLAGRLVGEMGDGRPWLQVDTENVAWDGDAFQFDVSVKPQEDGEPVGPGKDYRLSIPIAENGEADYGGIEALANQAAREWVQDHVGAGQDAVKQAVREHLQEVAKAYVSWVIAEQQKDVQRFWDAFNGELKKKLEEATKLEKKVEEVRAKLKKGVADLEVKTTNRFTPGITMGLSIAAKTLWKELPGSMAEIAEGLSKLPGNMHKELSGSAAEIVKGLEFGFLAAGWAVLEAGWVVLRDVAAVAGPGLAVKIAQHAAKKVKVGQVLYKFARPVVNPSGKARRRIFIGEQVVSEALSTGNVIDFWLARKTQLKESLL